MRTAIFLVGISLLFSASAGAQGPTGASSGPFSTHGPISAIPHSEDAWQLSVGYQYNRDNLLGSPFNTHGANVSLTRYFGRWIGVEAQIGVNFIGNTGQTTNPPNLDAKSLFVGVGPRLTIRNHTRYEPWVHVLAGMQLYRFSQTSGLLGNNNALAGPVGGGVDVHLAPRLAFRTEADIMGSRFFSTNQRSFQAIAGIVVDF